MTREMDISQVPDLALDVSVEAEGQAGDVLSLPTVIGIAIAVYDMIF